MSSPRNVDSRFVIICRNLICTYTIPLENQRIKANCLHTLSSHQHCNLHASGVPYLPQNRDRCRTSGLRRNRVIDDDVLSSEMLHTPPQSDFFKAATESSSPLTLRCRRGRSSRPANRRRLMHRRVYHLLIMMHNIFGGCGGEGAARNISTRKRAAQSK
jgi:hypothetical protein